MTTKFQLKTLERLSEKYGFPVKLHLENGRWHADVRVSTRDKGNGTGVGRGIDIALRKAIYDLWENNDLLDMDLDRWNMRDIDDFGRLGGVSNRVISDVIGAEEL